MKLKTTCSQLFLLLLVFLPAFVFAQTKKKVEIKNADTMEYSERVIANAQRLIGHVEIKHNNILMWCDSAYSYTDTNVVEAFGHVHILKDDTLNLYSDFLNYNGDLKWAVVSGHVKLVNKNITLTTDSMDYDLNKSVGYYTEYGTVKDSTSTLVSKIGEYYASLNKAYFKTDVEAFSDDYTLSSDTLIYDTQTKVVSIVGPTSIQDGDNNLYAENGFYNSLTGNVELYRNPEIITKEQTIDADSIYYNKASGNGRAIGKAKIEDFKNQMIVKGNLITYNDQAKTAMATDSAHFLLYSDQDTLYLHADTLKSIPDTIPDQKLVMAYFHVKFFREDMQGECDSMVYWSSDSTIQLFHDPVIWSGSNQMTASYIEMIQQANGPDLVKMEQNTFIIAQEDSSRFNQIKGRNMLGYIQNNQLYKIDVDGNGQSLYYASDKNGIIGLNKAQSSSISIFLENSKVKRIVFIKSPDGQLIPLLNISQDEKILPGFKWLDDARPKKVTDIFDKQK